MRLGPELVGPALDLAHGSGRCSESRGGASSTAAHTHHSGKLCDTFWMELTASRHLTTGSLDFYFDHKTACELRAQRDSSTGG